MKTTARKSTCPSALATAQLVYKGGRGTNNSKWSGVCRACLSAHEPQRLISLFLYWTPPWRPRRTSDDQIAKQLSKLTCVQIEECDGYPQHICHDCFETFKEAYSFYYSVRHKDNVMRSQQLLVEPAPGTWTDEGYDQRRDNNGRTSHIQTIHMENDYEEEYVQLEPKQEADVTSALSLDCILCQKEFLTLAALREHVLSTHSYKNVTRVRQTVRSAQGTDCKDCRRNLVPQNNGGREESKSRCDACSEKHMDTTRKTKTVQQLRREAELETPAKRRKDEEIYECDLCKEKFEEKLYLKIHTEAHHNVAEDESRSNEKRPAAVVEAASTNFQVQLLKTTDQVDSQNLLELLGYTAEVVQSEPNLPRVITSDNAHTDNFGGSQIIYDIGLRHVVEAADSDRANGQVAFLDLPHTSEEPPIVPDSNNLRVDEDGDENTIIGISEIKREQEHKDDDEQPTISGQSQRGDIEMASAVKTKESNDIAKSEEDDLDKSRENSVEISQENKEDNGAMSASLLSIEGFLEKDNKESINQNGDQPVERFLPHEKDSEENINEDTPQRTDESLPNEKESQDNVSNVIPQSTQNEDNNQEAKKPSKIIRYTTGTILPNLNDIAVRAEDKRHMEIIFSDSENEEDDRPPYLEIIFDDDQDEDIGTNPRPFSVHMPDPVQADEAQKETTAKVIVVDGPKVSSNESEESKNGDHVS